MGNKLRFLQCIFFKYAYACYVFETMDRVPWITTRLECNAWLCIKGDVFLWYANEMHAYTLGGVRPVKIN